MQPLDEDYLTWLYSQIASVKTRVRSRSYWNLARYLYTKEFAWLVPNDENRAADGRDLRILFLRETGLEEDLEWMELGCSMLEVLIGLSKRISFEMDGTPQVWFWHLIQNLRLGAEIELSDLYDFPHKAVDRKIETLLNRTYHHSGTGGLFPLQHTVIDQRNVELWDQMCAYLIELE